MGKTTDTTPNSTRARNDGSICKRTWNKYRTNSTARKEYIEGLVVEETAVALSHISLAGSSWTDTIPPAATHTEQAEPRELTNRALSF